MLLSEKVLRSAMASKLAYSKNKRAIISDPVACKLSRTLIGDITNEISCGMNNWKDNVIIIEKPLSGAHAYIWSTGENSKVVAFRGSHNARKVLQFLDMRKKEFNFCEHNVRVHKVVHSMFEDIEYSLMDELFQRYDDPQQNITFCGHSLGGSLATYSAAYIGNIFAGRHNIACHTFGAPMLGNEKFLEWYNKHVMESIHIKNKFDMVTYLPGVGYNDVPRLVFDNGDINPFTEHDLDTYIKQIRNRIEVQKLK